MIEVTAEDETVNLYTITITKLDTLGTLDARLASLTLSDSTDTGELKTVTLSTPFTHAVTNYTAEVSFDTTTGQSKCVRPEHRLGRRSRWEAPRRIWNAEPAVTLDQDIDVDSR